MANKPVRQQKKVKTGAGDKEMGSGAEKGGKHNTQEGIGKPIFPRGCKQGRLENHRKIVLMGVGSLGRGAQAAFRGKSPENLSHTPKTK